MTGNYKARLRDINTFIFDVDGVFTNNIVWLTPEGEQMRTANVRDGYAVQLAVKKGLTICIISGGTSQAVRRRFEGLGVKHVHLGSAHKIEVMNSVLSDLKIEASDVCYMGDDIPDMAVMKKAGLACCPADAVPEIKALSAYISPRNGGEGCVRDILEQALKVKGLWLDGDSMVW